jgi:hypothetical protein
MNHPVPLPCPWWTTLIVCLLLLALAFVCATGKSLFGSAAAVCLGLSSLHTWVRYAKDRGVSRTPIALAQAFLEVFRVLVAKQGLKGKPQKKLKNGGALRRGKKTTNLIGR